MRTHVCLHQQDRTTKALRAKKALPEQQQVLWGTLDILRGHLKVKTVYASGLDIIQMQI